MSRKTRQWVRSFALVAAVLTLLWIAYALRPVLTPLLVALAIAYIFNPVMTGLERLGVRRLVSIIALYVLIAALLATAGLYVTGQLITQIERIQFDIVRYYEAATDWVVRLSAAGQFFATSMPATAGADGNTTGPQAQLDWMAQLRPIVQQHGVAAATAALSFVTGAFSDVLFWLSVLVLIPMYTFVFLWRFNEILAGIRAHLPAAYRDVIVRIATITDRAIADFFRGRLIVCLLVGLVCGVGWQIAGVKNGLLLGMLAGTLNLVPFMSMLSLPPVLFVRYMDAMQAGESWVIPLLLTFGVYMLAQALESLLLTPLIEARSSGLHPVTTVVVLLIGAQIAGLLGMLLSIPIASTLKTLAVEFVMPEVRRLAGIPNLPAQTVQPSPEPPPAAEPESHDDGDNPHTTGR